jgi:hypothetical protein
MFYGNSKGKVNNVNVSSFKSHFKGAEQSKERTQLKKTRDTHPEELRRRQKRRTTEGTPPLI